MSKLTEVCFNRVKRNTCAVVYDIIAMKNLGFGQITNIKPNNTGFQIWPLYFNLTKTHTFALNIYYSNVFINYQNVTVLDLEQKNKNNLIWNRLDVGEVAWACNKFKVWYLFLGLNAILTFTNINNSVIWLNGAMFDGKIRIYTKFWV